jgi:alkylated DNA repair protein alkB family protein 1
MYGKAEPAAAAATERTAFRQAEKKYKLYKPPSAKGRGRRSVSPFPTSRHNADIP